MLSVMFEKILVANRGEIACRVIRTCRKLGVKTAVVYSEADRNCLHIKFADESYFIGASEPEKSYLNIEKVIEVAKKCGAEAIHPGYGFLAERADFAKACEESGIKFIGPKSRSMEILENKVAARKIMRKAGIAVIPGSEEPINSLEEAKELAEELSFPVLVKAVYGGGGRGLRIANNQEELEKAFEIASMEAKLAFEKPEIYIEKYISPARHVEFQILADEYGNVIHLGERECSVQRRYQKLLEECPSPALNEELRGKMGMAAVKVAKTAGYTNAGTIEFLLDKEGNFYFLEVNKRVQVEHLVTELVTGIDIVEEQIRIAAGEKLRYRQEDIKLRGWAINCRINCEDPARDFSPHPGMVLEHKIPKIRNLRVDTHLYKGYEIPFYYDSLIAKVAVWAETREKAIEKMKQALKQYIIKGVPTTIPFHLEILNDPNFVSGNYDTNFVERRERLKEIAAVSTALATYIGSHLELTLPMRKWKERSGWVAYGRKELSRKPIRLEWLKP